MLPFAASENEVRSGAAIVRLFRARCNLLFWALSSAVQVTIGLLCIRLGFHLLGVIVLASLTAPWVYGALMYLIEGKLMWGILTGMGLQPLLQLAFVNREEPLLRSRNVSHISVFTSWSVLASLYLGILVFGEFSSFLSDLRTIPSGLFQERVEQAVRLAAFGFVCCGLQVGWIMTDTHMSLVLRELPPSPRNAGERGCSFGAWAWRHRRETVRFFLGFLAQTIDFSIRIGSLASSVADVPWLILISFVINLLVLMIVTIVFENHFISNFYMGLGIILVGPFILILAGEATVISSLYSARNLLVVRLCEFFVYGCAHTLVGTFSWNPWVHRLYLLGLCELFGLLLMMLLMMLASRMTERPSTGSNLRSPLLGAAAPQGVQLVPQQQQQQQQPPPPPRVNTHIQGRDGESGQARTEEQAEGDREGPRHPPSSSSISMALPSAPPPRPQNPPPSEHRGRRLCHHGGQRREGEGRGRRQAAPMQSELPSLSPSSSLSLSSHSQQQQQHPQRHCQRDGMRPQEGRMRGFEALGVALCPPSCLLSVLLDAQTQTGTQRGGGWSGSPLSLSLSSLRDSVRSAWEVSMRRFAASLAEETGRQGGEGERGVARRARARARGRGVQENPSEFGIELSSLRSSQVASAQRRRQAEVRGSEWEREDLGQGERRQVGGTSSHLNDGMRDDKGRRRHSSASLTRHTARRDLIDDRVYDKTSSFESDAGAPSVSLCSSSSSSFFRVGERSQKPMKMMHQQTGGNRQQQQPGQGKEGPRGASRGRAEGGEQSSDSWSEVEVEKREREGEKQERIEEQHHLRTRPLYGNSKRKDGGGRKSATKRFFLLGDSEGEAAASLSTSSRLSERGNTEREGGGAIQLGRLQRGLRTSSFENVSENEMGKVREKFEADREKETAWKNEDREKGLEQNFPEKGTGEIWREHSDFCDEKKKDRHISVEWKHERGTGEGRSIPAKVAA